MSRLARVHEDILRRGWALTSSAALGLPPESQVASALSPALEPDPRGPGKLHARDVIGYYRHDPDAASVSECASVAHGSTDDFSRFRLLDSPRGHEAAMAVLELVPPELRRPAGRMSADYFRYAPGTRSDAHRDGFGDFVVIWVLDRTGAGAESFLTDLEGRDVMRGPLVTGSVLAFRDEIFLHGVTPLRGGTRDALIFITLRDGKP